MKENRIVFINAISLAGGATTIFTILYEGLDINKKIVMNGALKNKMNFKENAIFFPFIDIRKNIFYVFRFIIYYPYILFKLFFIIKKNDIILANNLISLLYVSCFKYIYGNKIILHNHSSFKKTSINKKYLSWYLNIFCNKIIVPSKYLKKDLIELGVKYSIIYVVYNGLDKIKTGKIENTEKLIIGVFGDICRLKGQIVFAEAIRQLSEKNNIKVEGRIQGYIFEKPYYEKLKKEYSCLIYNGILKFYERTNREEALDIMSKCDIIICPSIGNDVLPTVLIEAMAMKKATIGTRVGGIPEIIEDGITGLIINPDSVTEIVNAVIKLKNINTRIDFGKKGYDRFKKYFSSNRFINEVKYILS